MSPLDLDDADSLRRAYVDEGLALSAIAETTGCSAATVRRALLAHGIEIRRAGPAPIGKLRDRSWLEARVREGRSARDIAGLLGCAEGTVRSALQWAGLSSSAARERPSALDDVGFLKRAYVQDGRSVRSIAQEVGCTKDAVLQALRRHEIPIRPRGRTAQPVPAPGGGATDDAVPRRAHDGAGPAVSVGGDGGGERRPLGRRLAEIADRAPPVERPLPLRRLAPPDVGRRAAGSTALDAGAGKRASTDRGALHSRQPPGPAPIAEPAEEPVVRRQEMALRPVAPAPRPAPAPPGPRYEEYERPNGDGPVGQRRAPAARWRVDVEIEKIETKTFSIVRRGYDRQEVREFLRAVAEEYRKVVRTAKEAVTTAREEAVRAGPRVSQPPAPPASSGPAMVFDDVGGRVAAVLTSAAEAAEEIKATAEREALAIRQKAREDSEHLRRRAAADAEEAKQRRAASEHDAAAILAEAQAEAEAILADAQTAARRLEEEAEQRSAALERTARANVEAVLAEARRDYEHLRSVQQQCIDRLASVEFLARHARDGMSEGVRQSIDELL